DHLVVRGDRLAGVAPVTGEDVVLERALASEVVVHVGDLELAATRRLELRDDIEDIRLVAVEAGHGEPAGWVERLLFDPGDPPLPDPRPPQMPRVLRPADMCEQAARAVLLRLEVGDRRRDRAAVDVVGEHDDEALVADELAGQAECLCNATGALLPSVLDVVAEVPAEVVGVVCPGDEEKVADAGRLERARRPTTHGLLADRQQVLVGGAGERTEPGAGPASEDDALHANAMLWEPWS